jgi:hypothetical protein
VGGETGTDLILEFPNFTLKLEPEVIKKQFIEPPNTGNFHAFNRGAKESRNQIIITLIICLGKNSRFWYFLGRFRVDSVPVRVLRKTEETAFMYPN